jgi:hypothetical protein
MLRNCSALGITVEIAMSLVDKFTSSERYWPVYIKDHEWTWTALSNPCKTNVMDLPLALHTAARRFCANQHDHWSTEYRPLSDSGQDRVGMGYSIAAYRLFPRYRLDKAIQIEVERSTGVEFHSLEEARVLLLDAGGRALSSLRPEFQDSKDACMALNDEYKAFEMYVAGMGATQLGQIEPLPYRRVLEDAESERLRHQLRASWGVNGYWYPLSNFRTAIRIRMLLPFIRNYGNGGAARVPRQKADPV